MKTVIPEALKSDVPQTKWGKLLIATPVIMTVIATALAGLASSEMTRAQYDRSLAAQQQSKAGDQWGYFQAKKLRGALQHNTLDILQSTVPLRPLDAEALNRFGPVSPAAIPALVNGTLPEFPADKSDPKIKAALDAAEQSHSDAEVLSALAPIKPQELEEALKAAKERAADFDNALKPINQALDRLEKSFAVSGGTENARDFTAARLRYTAARYDAEARLNQAVANLLELQVRKSNLSAERHHRRSQRFFFGMLGAQMGVIVSTFSLAARQRSFLWALAAAAGLAAVSFAAYVYLFI